MAPRKWHSSSSSSSGSSSKKLNPNQNSQPSKFGIQHFFQRHSQSHNNNKDGSQNPPKAPTLGDSLQNNKGASDYTLRSSGNASDSRKSDMGHAALVPRIPENRLVSKPSGPYEAVTRFQKPRNEPNLQSSNARDASDPGISDLKNAVLTETNPINVLQAIDPNNPSQNTPRENLIAIPINAVGKLSEIPIDADENLSEASPEVPKSLSVKRLKFSPGMLIKQSQDDGGDEVTWKISPVNERLQAMSKYMPEVIRTLADASRLNFSNFHQCSQKKVSPGLVGQLESLLSSPQVKGADRSLVFSSRLGLKRVDLESEKDMHGKSGDINNKAVPNRQSPFRTPPPLSYCHEKSTNGVACGRASNLLDLGQHKKALLELLDQVEDVISVEDSILDDPKACSARAEDGICNKLNAKVGDGTNGPANDLVDKFNRPFSKHGFLVLEVSEKCRPADSSGSPCSFKVLRLLNEQSGEEHAVRLWDEWFYSVVAPGDTVGVVGQFNDQGMCNVDCEKNLIIVHPDMLVSGTRVASSFSCPRRTVLDERLKSSEHSTAALLGTLLHQIFQAALVREIATKEFLEEYASIVLQKNVESLYACGVNEADMMKTLIEAIPKILNWITHFKVSQDSKTSVVDFGFEDGHKKMKITEVIDIEEMAWAPKYGLKGMIDASLRVKVEADAKETGEKIVPLEFKTGKSTNGQSAMEHRAQVLLYTLLLSERYLKNIDSGLLYYLHTDQTQGISIRRSDLVGLIMRRNELANDILKASTTQQLPLMLQSPSMCRGCRHLNSCMIYHKAHGGNAESSGLGDVFMSCVNHLTMAYCAFLRHWDRLIDLEAKEMQAVKKEIWHSHGSEHGHSANCLPSVVLDTYCELAQEHLVRDNDPFIYQFLRHDLHCPNAEAKEADPLGAPHSATNGLDCSLRAGDYVILSTEFGNVTIASGIITEISNFHVSISFSKRLRLPSSYCSSEAQDILRQVWRIDKDEVLTSFAVMRFNLVQLFLQNERSSHLRKMIVDLELPRFDSGCIFSQDPAISYIWSEKSLNNDQRKAILKILTAKDYALILGMPGTGKTSTMVHAVKALLMRGSSILLTSYTNSAIDNLLIKLKAQSIDFIRIGRKNAVHEEVWGHCFSAMDVHRVEEIKLRLDQVSVVAVTCLGITTPLLSNRRFDVCIMDEAGQTTLPVSLGPLMFSSIFVLVGDHYQLPPLVQSAEARESGMGVSLFCRLSEAHPQAISALQSQYRMCQGIMELSNILIYDNRLRCGSLDVANAKLCFASSKFNSSWLEEVLDSDRPVTFINTDLLPAFERKDQNTVNNPIEANIIAEVAENLIIHGIDGEDIGIITPYNSQANLIRHTLYTKSVEIHTIDKYQGRDKDCILVSFVRSRENPWDCVSSLLGDWHRINVALTRAKKKLIMVGACRTLSKVPLLKLLIDNVNKRWGILSVSKKNVSYNGPLKGCSQFR